jgi:hypothetical protein
VGNTKNIGEILQIGDIMSDKIYHFWYSEKMKQAGFKLDRSYRSIYIIIGGEKKEYTEARENSEPSNVWDDNIYLGYLAESEFWKAFSIERKKP